MPFFDYLAEKGGYGEVPVHLYLKSGHKGLEYRLDIDRRLKFQICKRIVGGRIGALLL